MRLNSLLLFFILVLAGCGAFHDYDSVAVDGFAEYLERDGVICLDVRTTDEYVAGHIPGAVNVDVLQEESFLEKAKEVLPEGASVAVYCRSGRRSRTAAGILADNGYEVVNLKKGFESWTDAGKGTMEELWIDNGSNRIFGILSRPEYTGEKQPVFIVAHGFNCIHDVGNNYHKRLNELGYQCYAFDFTNGSAASRSGGNTMEMSLLDECRDVKAIIRYFRSQPDVDPDRIVLLGESQGGLVSTLVADEMYEEISKLVLIYPAFRIPDNWTRRYRTAADIPDTTRMGAVRIGRRFFEEMIGMNAFDHMDNFEKPVIIIQGDRDPIVSLKDSEIAVEKYKDARLYVIKGAGHGYNAEEVAESLGQISAFLKDGNK